MSHPARHRCNGMAAPSRSTNPVASLLSFFQHTFLCPRAVPDNLIHPGVCSPCKLERAQRERIKFFQSRERQQRRLRPPKRLGDAVRIGVPNGGSAEYLQTSKVGGGVAQLAARHEARHHWQRRAARAERAAGRACAQPARQAAAAAAGLATAAAQHAAGAAAAVAACLLQADVVDGCSGQCGFVALKAWQQTEGQAAGGGGTRPSTPHLH